LSQLHLLLTGECKYECDHCFVWSGPEVGNTMTRDTVARILAEALALGTIEWIYFEGGEPFLYDELLLWGVQQANRRGFKVGIVSNAYWAEDEATALGKLRPLKGLVQDLSISDDAYHGSDESGNVAIARKAARELDIPVGFISINGPDGDALGDARPALTAEDTSVRYRGRAAEKLAPLVMHQPWDGFTECPWEELRQPERVHVDSLGNLHACQGLVIGNLLEQPLGEIMRAYDPDIHPVVGPLLRGGPAELVRAYGLNHDPAYADACHLCYFARCKLREQYPGELAPVQMYGLTD
jgi:MoaA/NifB/PqqE/SkfB family radical SAM enzyme